LPQLLEYLSILLGDRQYFVAGPAVSAFLEVCPEKIEIIHKHYRSLVKKLIDMDEWSQLATIRLLIDYSRRCFPRKTRHQKIVGKKGFYEDEKDDEIDSGEEVLIIDHDLELFLKACKPLLQSRNSAVVVAVVGCYLYLAPPEYLKDAAGPLAALLRSPSDIQQIALNNIVSVALVSPSLFVPYASHFLVHSSDPQHIWQLKIEILTLIFPHCGLYLRSIILSELEHFSRSPSLPLVRASVQAIGRCAQSDPRTFSRAFKVLLNQVMSFDDTVVSEALTVIRHLIQQDPTSHQKTVIRLAKNLDSTTSAEARATIIWLVGEFAGIDPQNNIAPDVLRILAKGFAEESEAAKQQIVLLAAKVYLCHLLNNPPSAPTLSQSPLNNDKAISKPDTDNSTEADSSRVTKEHPIVLLWQHILLLTRYDTSYDLRDRARVFKALLSNPHSTQLASLILLAPKPIPHVPSPSESRRGLMLGSSTLVIGEKEIGGSGLPGYRELPEWVKEGKEPDPRLRDEVGEKVEYVGPEKAGRVPAGRKLDEAVKEQRLATGVEGKQKQKEDKGKSLDDWLEESEEEESGETGEESEEEEGSTEEESGSEEDEDEEECESGEESEAEKQKRLAS
jgi:vesicle coat complex subunit